MLLTLTPSAAVQGTTVYVALGGSHVVALPLPTLAKERAKMRGISMFGTAGLDPSQILKQRNTLKDVKTTPAPVKQNPLPQVREVRHVVCVCVCVCGCGCVCVCVCVHVCVCARACLPLSLPLSLPLCLASAPVDSPVCALHQHTHALSFGMQSNGSCLDVENYSTAGEMTSVVFPRSSFAAKTA